MRQVLVSGATISDSFGTSAPSFMGLRITSADESIWSLESLDPNEVWSIIDSTTLRGSGAWQLDSIPGFLFRLSGNGNADAWIYEDNSAA